MWTFFRYYINENSGKRALSIDHTAKNIPLDLPVGKARVVKLKSRNSPQAAVQMVRTGVM